MKYTNLTDEQLVALYKKGEILCFEEIYKRYVKLINAFSRSYYLIGGDEDDVRQEASLGLMQAILDYEDGKNKFSTFAYLCMKRRVLNAIKQANATKNIPLNQGVPLLICDTQNIFVNMPEEEVMDKENVEELIEQIKNNLSKFEYKVFIKFFLEGLNYKAIALELKVESKKIDNAIQRIKTKLKKFLED